jgi:preprotein translocase subunit YajC
MELLTTLLSAIPTVGFPIAMAIAMGVFIYRIYKRSEQREDILMEEIQKTREVNAQAIETITKYADSITTIENDISEIKTDITILRANGGNHN